MSRAQRSMQWCAAEPGPLQALSVGRSRICGASLHAAPYPGNVFDLLRIPLTPRSSASWCTGCNSRRPSAATSAHHWRRSFYWPCTDRGRFSARPSRLLLGIFGIDSARENRIRGDHRPSRCAASARTLRWRQIALRFAEIIPLHSIETVGGFRLFVFGAAFGHRQRLCRSSLHSKNGNDCRSNKQGITRGRGSFHDSFHGSFHGGFLFRASDQSCLQMCLQSCLEVVRLKTNRDSTSGLPAQRATRSD
jgi:hypothetical protein